MEEKKNLATTYNPKDFEERIYKTWEEKKYFTPVVDKTKKPFSIVMPPPNITGRLHLGHALDNTLQDMLIRFKRMQGYCTLWLPGQDHASIATEVKVENELLKQGLVKKEMGREAFLEKVWEWSDEYRGHIREQLKKMGVSADFSREAFTMDENLNKAVRTVFVKLYNEGLIYQGNRITNWCPKCTTALSDAEIEYEEKEGSFWHINYPLADGSGYLEIATTRPETLLGDTAVAVNPNDDRFKHLIGKTLKLPLTDREIPVVGDDYVDIEFGTGAVKITPAHDPNDFEVGKRHNLPIIRVMDDHGVINELGGKYQGLDRYEARKQMVKDLEEQGLLVKVKPHTHNVGTHDRCGTVIEPIISKQWYVKMESLAKPAIEAVRGGKTKFVPERFDKIYFNWMENIQDWCISRQLWWGHRIPAYYCDECGHINVSKTAPEKCEKCGSTKLHQDEDSLDTWFSSALWPFSTLGWPNMDSEDLKTFYPTNVLVTGYDIIFFWVARMIFSGLECMKQKPFSDILIHGIVRDSQGRKMSKSLGNGIDPLEVIDQYSTDALRFSLVLGISAGNDIRYMPEKLEQASNFANKLWNAAKFVLMNLDGVEKLPKLDEIDTAKLAKEDKWIISKLNTLSKEVNENITNYDLGVATQKIYDFIWNEFCDWYIEIVKTRLYGDDKESKLMAQVTLNEVLMNSLKLLHPIMPFITEEIYLQLFNIDESIMISKFPQFDEKYNFKADEEEIEKLKEIIIGIRNLRASSNVHPSKKTELIFVTTKYKYLINQSEGFLKKLGYSENIKVQENKEGIAQNALSIITDGIELYIPFEELVDIEEERKRMEEEKKKVIAEIERASKMLSNPGFVNKAPEAKINEEKAKLEKYQNMLKNLEERLK